MGVLIEQDTTGKIIKLTDIKIIDNQEITKIIYQVNEDTKSSKC